MVMLLTYGTVIVQVAFPFTLFNRRVKNVLLVAHDLRARRRSPSLLGLPFFSLAMIAADAVFLPTAFLRLAGRPGGPGAGPAVALAGGGRRCPEPRTPADERAGGRARRLRRR